MTAMRIAEVAAHWLSWPIPEAQRHVSDFGRNDSFDMTLVSITLDNGLVGYGEAKAAVGSQGTCEALALLIERELAPKLVGRDARQLNALWSLLYNGPRAGLAAERGRSFPILGRRGLMISAISGIDLALWDIAGKTMQRPVLDLVGGAVRDRMPGYASGGWAPVDRIGEQLGGYVSHGFRAVKMRVGAMDRTVAASVARVAAARDALGPEIAIMVDAHGTYDGPEARDFCRRTAELDLRWFEEPVTADARAAMEEVRRVAPMPIAMGESEFTCIDFQELIARRVADVLQPDMAICGGFSEGLHISALAVANQLELAPHCWGSALSFRAGLTLAFASPATRIIEFSLGANPFLHDLVEEPVAATSGDFAPPTGDGWGVRINRDFVKDFSR